MDDTKVMLPAGKWVKAENVSPATNIGGKVYIGSDGEIGTYYAYGGSIPTAEPTYWFFPNEANAPRLGSYADNHLHKMLSTPPVDTYDDRHLYKMLSIAISIALISLLMSILALLS